MNKLILPTLKTLIVGALALGALIVVPAGTPAYWQAWVFIAVFMVGANGIGVYLSIKDPALLERRKQVGPGAEKSIAQKIIISFGILSFLGVMLFCGLDHRFGWSHLPPYVCVAGDALVALGFLLQLFVFRENTYGGANVRTFEGQRVISTGPYARVRHPMYVGVLVMVVGTPLALGSWWGLAVVAVTTPVLIFRILDEERFLERDLPGYTEYTRKVRYRLVPHLW